jgi:hypothetical protein
LFKQGLADPRGCEYRTVRVTVDKSDAFFRHTSDSAAMVTHAWVIPSRPGDQRRFAVCWNGLVCPVQFVGDKADLTADVATSIRYANGKDEDEMLVDAPPGAAGWARWHKRLKLFSTCLLLRLGEGDLASKLWEVQKVEEETFPDAYSELAWTWMHNFVTAAFDAHRRGDDELALHSFRRLVKLATVVESATTYRGLPTGSDKARLVDGFQLLPDLLADQERRAREKRCEPVVCIGPGRIADQTKRIAALIARLDEVTGESYSFDRDPIVCSLVREGAPAIDPLLECLEKDNRLTRQIYRPNFMSGLPPPLRVRPVHEVANGILCLILKNAGDSVPDRVRMGSMSREHLAEAIWTCRQQASRKSLAERWLQVLADDQAGEHRWSEAAEALFRPAATNSDAAATWDALRGQAKTEPTKPAVRPVDQFRGKRQPSITELLCKRLEQSRTLYSIIGLAGWLAEWDPGAALPVLAKLKDRIRWMKDWESEYRRIISIRIGLGDKRALDEYADWLRNAPRSVMEQDFFGDTFRLMWENPDHPGMVTAARALFGENGSWLPLWPPGDKGRSGFLRFESLLETPLLRVDPFRKAVQSALAEKSRAGFAKADGTGAMEFDWGDGSGSSYPAPVDAGLPMEKLKGDFRVCDYVAWLIARSVETAPRCELYWPEARRQAAVDACVAFLERYGRQLNDTRGSIAFPHRDAPADAEHVRQGKAIFSLAADGTARVVRLPAFPLEARWTTLKEFFVKNYDFKRSTSVRSSRTYFLQQGNVWQAEEVLKDGKWQRYYGFAGSHCVARVPAEEIEFPAPREGFMQGVGWVKEHGWIEIPGGMDARLLVPSLPVEPDWDGAPRFAADTPLRLSLAVRNRSGLDRRVPWPLAGMRLRLWHSPEVVSRKGALEPFAQRETDWAEMPAKSAPRPNGAAGQSLGPAAESTVATVDLLDMFDFREPGFYRLRLTRTDWAADKRREAAAEIRFSLAPDR